MNLYKLLGIGHYEFWAEIFTKVSRHLDKLLKNNQVIWIKGKNTKNRTSWQENQYPEKKGEREGCLLFWLKIYSIIGNSNSKLVWRQVPKLEFCWVFFFQFFLLYSRAILSFSLSPSLLLCPFHCFNCWIILEKLSC